jgi:hypothetical protein
MTDLILAIVLGLIALLPASAAMLPATVPVEWPVNRASEIDHSVSATVHGGGISGTATWYATGPGAGHAAAGPALRTGDWRGRHVTVCGGRGCVPVVLDDFCQCYGTRVIDLATSDFARLAPLSQGIVTVTITTAAVPVAPPTDYVP